MSQQVQFVQLQQSVYDTLPSKNAGTLYFTTDTKRVYKGDEPYTPLLTTRGGGGAWDVTFPEGYEGPGLDDIAFGNPDGEWDYDQWYFVYSDAALDPYPTGVTDQDALSITGQWGITASRQALPGYQLGTQSDKPLATAEQGAKADTAIQGIKVNGTTKTPDANNVVNITSIPKSALAGGVQTSLGKADTAIQGVKVNGTELQKDSSNKVNINLADYKTKQTAKSSPSASGSTTSFIDTISQDANGVITATKKNIQTKDPYASGVASGNVADALATKNAIDKRIPYVEDNQSHFTAETLGNRSTASKADVGEYSLAVGSSVKASGKQAVATGSWTVATGESSHAEGSTAQATGVASHAEGNNTQAIGNISHAEGTDTVAEGLVSHAEGNYTTAEGTGAHSEGMFSKASGVAAHAEGSNLDRLAALLKASGADEGIVALFTQAATDAAGSFSHTEGLVSETKQMGSHAQGFRASDNENQFSFVWQGYNGTVPTDAQMQALLDDPTSQDAQIALGCLVTALQARAKYSAKAPGTFCINPSPVGQGVTDPATGFYIGDKNLPTIIGEHVGKGKKVFYGTCSTAAATFVKDVVCEDFTTSDFVAGTVLIVKFTTTNTATTASLKVANTTKRFYIYGTTNPSTYMWHAGQIVEFVYDGSYWLLNKPQYATTSYEGAVKLVNSINSTYTDGYAATPNSVKLAYDGSVHTTQVKDPYASGVVAGDVASAASVKTYLDKRIPYVEDNQSNFTAETLGNRSTTTKADVGEYSLAVGSSVKASGKNSVATGNWTVASGESSHAEGNESVASGIGSHVEGNCGNAVGNFSHAEGSDCEANGLASHAEGSQTIITQDGIAAHAEGVMTMTAAPGSHIEGLGLDVPDGQGGTTHLGVAGGFFTHVEGMVGTAQGMASHIEGFNAHDGTTSNAGSFVWQGYQGTVPSNQQLSEYFANPESPEAQAFFASALQSTPAYAAKGQGTFNINPKPQGQGETDPASGFFIGQQSLKTRLKPLSGQTMPANPTQNELTEAVKKIWQALGGSFS